MRFKLVLPCHIRDAGRVTEAFAKHLEACLPKESKMSVIMAVVYETPAQARANDADTIFVESLAKPASSEELTFLSNAMVRTSQELKVHGFMLRTEPLLSIAA